MVEEIEEHFASEYPREGCGIIGIVKGKKKFFPCRNVAEDNDDFILASEDYFSIKSRCDIYAIVHSHPDSTSKPSESDIENCNALGIPYYIFSYPDMDLTILQPKVRTNELFGREYKFGTSDCFEAMRDYLASKNITIPARAPFEDNWWKNGVDYFNKETIAEWGFYPVKDMKPNDLLIFQVESSVPAHCGVYIGNDLFFHHAIHRLSCRENLFPMWAKYLVGIYRHEKA